MSRLSERRCRRARPGCNRWWCAVLLLGMAAPAALAAGPYDHTLTSFWSTLYARGGETLYCGERFGAERGRGINIEHVMPMAWAMNAFGCDDRNECRRSNSRFRTIEADIHNLFPSRRDINRARGSFTFGMVQGEPREFGKCDFEVDRRRRRVEPRTAVRGEVARAIFYMHDRYGMEIFGRLGRLLKDWNRADPPSADERRRNDLIERLQGNRNRFIDQPRAADRLRF